jgi:hypothetical protein
LLACRLPASGRWPSCSASLGGAPLLEWLGAGPAGQEIAYASANELLVAYRVIHDKCLVQVLSLVWLGDG